MKHLLQSLVRIVAVFGIAIAPIACTSVATAPAGDAHVEAVPLLARGGAPRVAVTNRSSQPIFTVVLGRNASALMLWAACVDAAECAPIAPGATRLETPAMIAGMAETEAVVHWWHAVRGADGVVRPDSVRSVIVRL